MARRKKRKNLFPLPNIIEALNNELIRGVVAIFFLLLALFLVLAGLNTAGVVGEYTFDALFALLGWGYPLLPFVLGLTAYILFRPADTYHVGLSRLISLLVLFFSGLGIAELMFEKGGVLGRFITNPLVTLFDVYVTIFILWGLVLITFVILLQLSVTTDSFPLLRKLFGKDAGSDADENYAIQGEGTEEGEDDEDEYVEDYDESVEDLAPAPPLSSAKKKDDVDENAGIHFAPIHGADYTPPPLSLLEKDKGKPGVGDIKANANIIKRTLQNFGITVEIDEISIGPSVTRYALKPAEGVRLSRILGLQNNLELALAAHPVRIEAPIPGRSLVGIEVPNTAKATVGLASLLQSDAFQSSEKPLLVTLGKDITGQTHFTDIAKMPHVLIAGTTGSGKSATIHALITSLLYRNSPQMLRFIMVDPKRVELTLYNNIPHLLTPVITDAKKAILALKWAAKEMDRRYDILEAERVRDIHSYHKNVLEPALQKEDEENAPEAMPYILVVIDELADIMQAYPRELEAAIVRLAQMSRAVGIHLLLSTQRPSVNVITGLIKANVPARIALQVSSQIDSRTILDAGGAEKLLGAGDMLYLSGEMSKPQRIQSAFISEMELKKITDFIVKNNADLVPDEVEIADANGSADRGSIFAATLDEDEEDDELYEEAKDIVVHAGKASTSYLQRKLRVGYARAARLMDILEERGVIGPADGSKPREVLLQTDDDNEEDEGRE